MCDIPVADLTVDRIYEIRSRNLTWAVYLGNGLFRGLREKFGHRRLNIEAVPGTVTRVIREVGDMNEGYSDEQLLTALERMDKEITGDADE
jgi:hypothetical protein